MALLRRKLLALDIPSAETFDVSDDGMVRNLFVSLEDTKIRHWKIEDRGELRNIQSDDWPAAAFAYLTSLGCPHAEGDWLGDQERRLCVLDWLLGTAVGYEYHDKRDSYNGVAERLAGQQQSSQLSIDGESAEAKEAAAELARLLKIPCDAEHSTLIRAISTRIGQLFEPAAVAAALAMKDEVVIKTSLEDCPLGFTTGDPVLDNAAKIMRLLHIAELRDLQTKVNELIVGVQLITADPKTDSRLGKVGK